MQKTKTKYATSTFLGIFLFLAIFAYGQKANQIKGNPEYIWVESISAEKSTSQEATLKNLTQKLSEIIRINSNPNTNKRLWEGYTSELLHHTSTITSELKNKYVTLRYIHSDSIKNIFKSREGKIKEMLSMAEAAEQRLQIDIALRNLSWAKILLQTLPEPESLAYKDRNGSVSSAKIWATDKKSNILKSTEAAFSINGNKDSVLVEIAFTYTGKPVRSLDYRFFNGKEWSGIYSAKDGRGVIENPSSNNPEEFKVKYESNHPHLMHIDKQIEEIKEILSCSNTPDKKAEHKENIYVKNIESIDKQEIKNKILSVLAQEEAKVQKPDSITFEIATVHNTQKFEQRVEEFCNAIKNGSYSLPDTLFSDEGVQIFNKLIKYGNARLLEKGNLNFYRLGSEIYCRSIPMVFSFSGNNRTFIEDIVLTFNSDARITNITFSLDKEAARDIVAHNNWPEEARIIIVTFLENYKTAYALERLDYISSIFDDQALIITGRVLKGVTIHNELMDNRYVTLTKQNKEQYIANLKRVFAANEFINISFNSSEVLMLGKGSRMYGIQLKQEYYSSNYSDKGYLFLMVDLKDHTQPVIHVRTWQTEPDKEFGIIGPYHF